MVVCHYAIQIRGEGRPFTHVIGSSHPEAAADTAITIWKEHRDDPGGVVVELPPEIEAILRCRGALNEKGKSPP